MLKLGRYGFVIVKDVVYILCFFVYDNLIVVFFMVVFCYLDVFKMIGEKVNVDKFVLSEWCILICSEDNMFYVNLLVMFSRFFCI